MTKGKAALPWRAVAEQKPFFITLGGPLAHNTLCRNTCPRKVRGTADPSASLGMTKGKAALPWTKGKATLPWRAVAEQKPFFIPSVFWFSHML
jgi:hypothetical protein